MAFVRFGLALYLLAILIGCKSRLTVEVAGPEGLSVPAELNSADTIVRFLDTDLDLGEIGGEITADITKLPSTPSFKLYWGNDDRLPKGHLGKLLSVNNNYSFKIPDGTVVPEGMTHILLYSLDQSVSAAIAIVDRHGPKLASFGSIVKLVVGEEAESQSFINSRAPVVKCAVKPTLPEGLVAEVLDGTCVVKGTPTKVQLFTIHQVLGFASDGSSHSASYHLYVTSNNPPVAAEVAPITLLRGVKATIPLPSSGGAIEDCRVTPVLPVGLDIGVNSGQCQITGIPTEASATTNYQVKLVAKDGSTAITDLSTTVSEQNKPYLVAITPKTLALAYAHTIELTNNGAAATLCDVDPALPIGLIVALSNSTCKISGTPSLAAASTDYAITATASDGSKDTIVVSLTVTSASPPKLANHGAVTLVSTVAITPIVFSNSASAAVTCEVTPTLPTGLSVNPNANTCQITGTASSPQNATTYTVTAKAIDGSSDTATVALTISAASPRLLVAPSVQSYTTTVTINPLDFTNNGSPAVTCQVAPTLPNGLVLSVANSTCQLTGTPTIAQASTTYEVTASAADGSKDSVSVAIAINAANPPILTDGAAQSFGEGITITPFELVNTGANVTACSSVPILPQGLSVVVANNTCQVTGTPNNGSFLKTYTITGVAADYSQDSATVEIVVLSKPLNPPERIMFTDFDDDLGKLEGEVRIHAHVHEGDVTGYALYWGTGPYSKLSSTPIAVVPRTGRMSIHTFAADSAIPSGATFLLVYARKGPLESDEGQHSLLGDHTASELSMRLSIDSSAQGADSSPTVYVKGGDYGDSISLYYGATCDSLIETKTKSTRTVAFTVNLASTGNYQFSSKDLSTGTCSSKTLAYSHIGYSPTTEIVSSRGAFAAIRADGSVVTWGNPMNGGDSGAVRFDLNGDVDVTSIRSTESAFAALRSDGSVVTWGFSDHGGDSSSVKGSLDGTIPVIAIYTTDYAFAALRNDGSVVTWGDAIGGGDSSSVSAALNGTTVVTSISATAYAFAALRNDGSVVTWGYSSYGGSSTSVSAALDGTVPVTAVSSTGFAFAAIRNDGSLVTWGSYHYGGDSSSVSGSLDGTIDVTSVHGSDRAFAAIRNDGSVITWGLSTGGGDSSSVSGALDGSNDVTAIYSANSVFAAVRIDGSVITWGDSNRGGDSSSVSSALDGTIAVTSISSNCEAFAALRADGSVVTWGFGVGNFNSVADALDGTINVSSILGSNCSSGGAFAALRADGSVVTWGSIQNGGDSSLVSSELDGTTDITAIAATDRAFAALRSDGTVVTWGRAERGGSRVSLNSRLITSPKVTQIHSTNNTSAAILADGSVEAWHSDYPSGNTSSVSTKLDGTVDVVALYSTTGAIAALRVDGSVATWGVSNYGGDSSAVSAALDGSTAVKRIYSTDHAFAALRSDGSVITWGAINHGGDSSSVASLLDGTIAVKAIYSTSYAFAAIRADGSVVTWGSSSHGGDSTSVSTSLDATIPVKSIYATNSAFAALRADGSVVTWGASTTGGDSSLVSTALDGTINVERVYSNDLAFAAVRADGSVVTWGKSDDGGDSSSVSAALDGTIDVIKVYSTYDAFAALRSDGSVVTWSDSYGGGKSSSVSAALDGTIDVITIAAGDEAFAALRADGSVITWGIHNAGGSSSSVSAALDGTVDVISVISNGDQFAALRSDGSVVVWSYLSPNDQSFIGQDVVDITGTSNTFTALLDNGEITPFVGGSKFSPYIRPE